METSGKEESASVAEEGAAGAASAPVSEETPSVPDGGGASEREKENGASPLSKRRKFALAVGHFFKSSVVPVVALAAASIMLLIGRQDIEEIVLGVEWSTILFFTGLFVIVGGMVKCGVISALGNALVSVTGGNVTLLMILILWGSAVFSSVLDNIPFVATMIPLILSMQTDGMDVTSLWWALSLGACLGGNGTLIGASANVVLSGISAKHGHPITFGHYLKVGFPTMVLSVAISTVYLLVRFH